MRIALTGANGIIGSAIAEAACAEGHRVTAIGRMTGYRLGDDADLRGHDALIHCAFAHVPGKYRGGEGSNPDGFRRANLDGSIRLFDAAARDGVRHVLFLSSRAVFDGRAPGMILTEDLPPRPTTLYGQVKAEAEAHLADLRRGGLLTTSVRSTGVYGTGNAHKWRQLFAEYLSGKPIEPRIGSEVHVEDLADAVMILLAQDSPPPVAHVSDILLDRRDLLAQVMALTCCAHPLPAADTDSWPRELRCDALHALGWQGGGWRKLYATLPAMLDDLPRL